MEKYIKIAKEAVFYFTLVLLPVFFLTIFLSPFILPKYVFLVIGLSLTFILWIAKIAVSKKIEFRAGKFDLAVLAIAIAYLATAIIKTPNKAEAFIVPGVTTAVLLSAVTYFLANQINTSRSNLLSYVMAISAALLAFISTLFQIGLFSKIPQFGALVKDVNFNPAGGYLPTFMYLLIITPLAIGLFIKEDSTIKKSVLGIILAVITLGITLSANSLFGKSTNKPKFIDLRSSWEIAVETFKKEPYFGVGPGNYLTAFNRNKPLTYNQTEVWDVKFTSARNYFLTAVTETGFVGIIALSFLLITIIYHIRTKPLTWSLTSVLVGLVLMLLYPVSTVVLLAFFIMLALCSDAKLVISDLKLNGVIPNFLMFLAIVPVSILLFYGGRATLAEYKFKKALDSFSGNDVKGAYTLLQEAIKLNPKVDRYHLSFGQIDIAVANTIASKKDITDEDKKLISEVIQHSVTEGKNAVSLNPGRSGNWENLASIYASIISFAKGADIFTVQTLNQAIALDPINPSLRISLGRVYLQLKKYDEAVKVLELAVLAKPDLASSHYHLALAYSALKLTDKAKAQYDAALSLLEEGSEDYKKVKAESDSAASASPVPSPTPAIEPQIELPEEAQPPQNEQQPIE